MNKTLVLLAAFLLIGCGDDTIYYPVEVPGPEVPVPAPVVELTEIEQLVADKNEFRVAAGQLPLTRGLTCTLHETSNPDLTVALPSAKYTFTLMDNFNQAAGPVSDRLNLLPAPIRAIYTNNYAIRCQGQIVITESGYYLFKLTSDDGSMLYIDGSLLINNNGNHGPTLVSGTKLLERGVHTFRLDYAQTGGGSQALILESEDGVIPSEVFYR